MSKLSLLLSYFLITPCIIILALVFLLFDQYQYQNPHQAATFTIAPSTVYAALPDSSASTLIQTQITTSDARVQIISQFLHRYGSPLEPYADLIVNAADEYGLDYRLTTAIAGQESNWCRVIPANSYNCWGFAIYNHHVHTFDNYQAGITAVTKALATQYKDKGLVTPVEIMSMYTPGSNGSWASGVTNIMDELQ